MCGDMYDGVDVTPREVYDATNYCKYCAKKDVCKHIDNFNSIVGKCNEIIINSNCDFVIGDFRCKYYMKPIISIR